MTGNISDNDSVNYSWTSDEELEIEKKVFDSGTSLTTLNGGLLTGTAEASSSSGPSSTLFRHFVGAGFSENLVAKAVEENGEGDMDAILNALLTYSALESSPSDELDTEKPSAREQNGHFDERIDGIYAQTNNIDSDQKVGVDSDSLSSDYEENLLEDFSDSDSGPGIEETPGPLSEEKKKMLFLTDMGYPVEEVSIAIERCGPDSSLEELADFLCAAQMARASDASYVDPPVKPKLYGDFSKHKKRKLFEYEMGRKKQKSFLEEDEPLRLPKPMIGFGVPNMSLPHFHRTLPEAALSPPYFYYENVALAPKGVWDTISRFLYDVQPEFVDSKYFCAAARKRGYIHNLPIDDRFPLLPLPPRSIHEALPLTKKWWPHWDTRTKLNCLQTAYGSAKLTERIRKALEDFDGDPPMHVQKYVMDECRKWNLVWVGRNKVAPLEPDEVEMLLGFPRNHTRGGGISRTDRYKSLGNSFQVDTVAYHLSVLKDLFPGGMRVLSLFSGIGGAEVALHRLGIPLKTVVSVELAEVNRNIQRSWWEQTNQKGILIDIADVQQLTNDRLEQLINSFGGFDLVIGGSPCNNLAGSNRVSRDGLEGKESSLFFEYIRILDTVKSLMGKKL
ncbi:DNA (cytosine-5)-methyltransferase DRM2-like [Amaranthus tricolor]|uniref:DNA (cytosine-5)-methyltransferase DRM2-like n=1 Tax=Amaranthus tricolor TaxID=29722 RepID=UPI0025841B57|nr:DNA (cytosine-5)-methyltransferase DRM2-like [Amaranthus tricolor]